jgi:SAM-dependent methyltransferase
MSQEVAVSEYACMDTTTPQRLVCDFAMPSQYHSDALAVELGAGAGRNLMFLSQLGYQVVATESRSGHGKIHFSNDLILATDRQRFFEEIGIHIVEVEAGLPKIEPRSVALVVAMNVIQFILGENRVTVCRDITRWLIPNGRLIGSVVANRDSTLSRSLQRFTMNENAVRRLFTDLKIVHMERVTANVPETVSWSSTRQIDLIEFVCDCPA